MSKGVDTKVIVDCMMPDLVGLNQFVLQLYDFDGALYPKTYYGMLDKTYFQRQVNVEVSKQTVRVAWVGCCQEHVQEILRSIRTLQRAMKHAFRFQEHKSDAASVFVLIFD
ncbi:MAG TPA: hypothetical protein VI937_02640 [Negativicutes bacterium]|nr:hypothetical protein [Negativicutes bacterium]